MDVSSLADVSPVDTILFEDTTLKASLVARKRGVSIIFLNNELLSLIWGVNGGPDRNVESFSILSFNLLLVSNSLARVARTLREDEIAVEIVVEETKVEGTVGRFNPLSRPSWSVDGTPVIN